MNQQRIDLVVGILSLLSIPLFVMVIWNRAEILASERRLAELRRLRDKLAARIDGVVTDD